MPITNDGTIAYCLPEEYDKMMDYKFCKDMMIAIHNIWGISAEDYDYESVSYCEGTGGWNEAFLHACRVNHLDELAKYYCKLPWYDSDIFDGYVTEKFVSYKLILPKFESDEIARQLGLNSDQIKVCNKCGKYFVSEDVIKEVDENLDGDYESMYICKKCLEDKSVNVLEYDKKRTLKEILGLNESDYFICSGCGKIHFLYNKGKDKCNYCEYLEISENKNANEYYQELIVLNEKYLRTFLPKKYEYIDYECEVKYSAEDDVFYGKITKYKGEQVSDLVSFHNESFDNMRKEFESAVNDYIDFKKAIGR